VLSHSRFHADAQGQKAGRCRSRRRLVVAIRAGMSMIRRRRVAQRAFRIPAAVAAARARLNAINLHEISDGQRVPKRMICGRSPGAAGGSSARGDVHLTYMTNITLTTEFALPPRGAW
jgi:hypothetical protein